MYLSLLRFLVLFLFLTPTPVQAALNWQLYEIDRLDGGLNDSFNEITLGTNEASDLQNIIFPRAINGAIASRPGYTNINSTAVSGTPTCTGTFFFKLTSGTRYLVSLWSDDKIRKMDYGGSGADGTWDDITGALSFNVGADDHPDFAVAENSVVIEDGLTGTAPYRWTGTGDAATLTADADLPNSSMVEYHQRHLFLAGNDSNPSRLYVSNLDDITAWTSTDFLRIETDSGDGIIRALKTGLDGLYVWKDSSIWRLSGTNRDDFILERMVQGIGTLSNQSVTIINSPTDNQQIFVFVTQHGDVAVYDGGVNVTIISHKIKNSFPNSIAFDRIDEVVATSYEFMYVVSVSTSGNSTHNRLYLFDFLHKAWTRFVGMNANAIETFENASGRPLLMFGDYGGIVSQWDVNDTSTYNDPSSTVINSFYTTGWLPFSESGLEKDVRALRVFVNQEGSSRNLDVEVRKDFEDTGATDQISLEGSGATWDSAVWDTSTYADLTVTIGRIEPGRGVPANLFQLSFSNGSRSLERFRIRKVQILVEKSDRV